MILGIQAQDIAVLSVVAGAVTPPIGGFLLVIKWIVNFQKEITDKYRQELFEVQREFATYKATTSKEIQKLNDRLDLLVNTIEDEQIYNTKLINFIKSKNLELPPELERRKAIA